MARDRNHKNGRFRATETSSYKMTKHDGFDAVSWQAFQEAALDKYDFARCQRPDGSYYGTGGQCRKGSPAGDKQEEPKKSRAKKSGGGEAKGGGSGEATAADLKMSVKIQDDSPNAGYGDMKSVKLGDLKKGGVGNDRLDDLESEARAGDLSPKQKEAAYRVLRDDHAAIKAEIKNSGVTDKEMNTLLTGGPKRLKQQLQTQEDIDKGQLPMNSQSRIYAKTNNEMRKNAKELIENEGKYTDLVAKVRSGKASEAQKDKYNQLFGWDATDKNVDRMMSNVAKINKSRGKGK
jgi:hypothetical protein